MTPGLLCPTLPLGLFALSVVRGAGPKTAGRLSEVMTIAHVPELVKLIQSKSTRHWTGGLPGAQVTHAPCSAQAPTLKDPELAPSAPLGGTAAPPRHLSTAVQAASSGEVERRDETASW